MAPAVGLLHQESQEGLMVWGPASVQVTSRDDKVVTMDAIQQSLPSFLRRGLLSIMHKDIPAGRILQQMEPDPDRIPAERRDLVMRLVEHHGGALPTEVVEVTPLHAELFPRLKDDIGKPVLFCAASVFEDRTTARQIAKDVRDRRLDSYSISGVILQSQVRNECDKSKCRPVEHVLEMDMNAVTLTSTKATNTTPWSQGQARNPEASFVVIQQSQTGDCDCGGPCCQDATTIQAPKIHVIPAGHGHHLDDHHAHNHGPPPPPQHIEQATPQPKATPMTNQTPKTAGQPVEQETPAPPEAAPPAPAGDELKDVKAMLMALSERLAKLEELVATGTPPPPASEEPAAPVEQAKPPAKVEQAKPAPAAPTLAEIKQAMTEAIKPVTERVAVLEQSRTAAAASGATPKPATPAPAHQAAGQKKPALVEQSEAILAAVDKGDQKALRSALNGAGRALREVQT